MDTEVGDAMPRQYNMSFSLSKPLSAQGTWISARVFNKCLFFDLFFRALAQVTPLFLILTSSLFLFMSPLV